jgi:hypothetical protein
MAEGAMIEIPPVMVEDALNEELNGLRMRLAQQRSSLEEYLRLNNQTEEEMREEMRPDTARRLRNSLLLREIAKRENVDVTDADVDAEIADLTAGSENAEQMRELYSQGGYFRRMLRNDLYDRRLTDRLLEIATEGRGPVVNGWTPPARDEAVESGAGEAEPKQPAVSVADVDQEPDATQAAAAGHEAEQAAVAAEQPGDEPAEFVAAAAPVTPGETLQEPAGAPPPETAAWVAGDGSPDCPAGYPIKGNASSHIYHVPGQSSYERTVPEICFASEDVAQSQGFRASRAGGGGGSDEE